jgi:hypothetical protein
MLAFKKSMPLSKALKPDEYGSTPFHDAAYYGKFEFCKRIMNLMIKNNVKDKNPKNKHGKTPLHKAACCGNYMICKLLMDNIENKCPIAKCGRIPLHLAAETGRKEIIEMILPNITKEEASIQCYKCYICKIEVSMERPACVKTAFENHFASEHQGKEPRGMTSYEYSCNETHADQEIKDMFRKFLEISETADVTKRKLMYVEEIEQEGLIETEKQFKAYIEGEFDPKSRQECKDVFRKYLKIEISELSKTKLKLIARSELKRKKEKNMGEKKKRLEKVEKIEARIKNEIQNLKIEIKKEIGDGISDLTTLKFQQGLGRFDELDVRIKHEIQGFKNELNKRIEEEIVDKPGTSGLKPKIEYKKIKKGEKEVQRDLKNIEKLEPPAKKSKLGQE